MKRPACLILLAAACLAAPAQPTCEVTYYDEFSGLSQRMVKQAVQDGYGIIWFATWNGLNRYDGYEFVTIRPRSGDGSAVVSDRVNDIKLLSTGNIMCRIDARCVLFDVKTYRFTDILADIEERFDRHIAVEKIRTTADGCTVLDCEDSLFVTMRDDDPVSSAVLSAVEPRKHYNEETDIAYNGIGGFARGDLLYADHDRYGTLWVITAAGDIYYTDDLEAPLTLWHERLRHYDKMLYTLTDEQGNVWLRSMQGVVKVSFDRLPYTAFTGIDTGEVRCAYTDSKGRTWVAVRDDGTVRLAAKDGGNARFLAMDGSLHDNYTRFGSRAYCITEDKTGNIWIGTKPDGAYRLKESIDGTFSVTRFRHDDNDHTSISADNIYDLCNDSCGRLWIATMKGGVNCVVDPDSDSPVFLHPSNGLTGYPEEAMSARRIVIVHDSILMVATTGGLVTADVGRQTLHTAPHFILHAKEPDRAASLWSNALMDIAEDSCGRVYVATESRGLCRIVTDNLLASRLAFEHLYDEGIVKEDIVQSVTDHNGKLWLVGDNSLTAYDYVRGTATTYGASFWRRKTRFSDGRPARLSDGRWLFGLHDGGMVIDLDGMETGSYVPRIAVTAVSIENRQDSLAVTAIDTITLKADERNLTIRFAALDYTDPSGINYAFKTDEGNGEWNSVGTTRSVTFLNMSPGEHKIMIRSTDKTGLWTDNIRAVTVLVTPQWWETAWAKALFAVLALLLIAAAVLLWLYIRAMRAKQKETLEAYLKLLEGGQGQDDTQTQTARGTAAEPAQPAADMERTGNTPRLNDTDRAFMKRVMDCIETNIHDADLSTAQIAAAAATSPSNLNRKMKRITNVTPAEFVKRLRLRRSAYALVSTDKPVNEIALECGFSDQNYFGKCFKTAYGATPTEYRKRQTGAHA